MKTLKEFNLQINEVLRASDPIDKWISDFVHSKNAKFAGKTTKERIEMAKGAYYGAQKHRMTRMESVAVSQNSTAKVDMREAAREHLVHVNDGSKYDEEPHEKDVEHIMAGVKQHGGEHAGASDKGVFFKFKSKEHADAFKAHANKCPNKSCDAEHVTEGYENDMADKKKVLNPPIPLTQKKKAVKDFLKKEEAELDEGKVYDPITKKMVASKPIKVQAGGGATRNGVPVETGPSKYKSKLPMSKAAAVLAAEEIGIDEGDNGLAAKAKKSGVSLSTLKTVYKRGVAAWNSGHRPGTTPAQWGMARVNSYITKGKGTYHGADKDLREDARLDKKEYHKGMSAATAKARVAHWKKADKMSDSNPKAYKPAPGDKTAKTTPSVHTKKYHAMYGEAKEGKNKWHIYDTKTREVHSTYNNKNVAIRKYEELNDKHKGYDSPGGLVHSKYGLRQELQKEETEINEISKYTLARYIDKAAQDVHDKALAAGSHHGGKSYKEFMKNYTKSGKRQAGITRAAVKLATQKEEVQVDEAIAKKLPVQHAVNAVTKTLGSQAATRFLGHLKPGTDKHTSWDKVNDALMKQGVQTHHIASIAQKTSHENMNESRGHKVLATFFKNREVAQRAFTGQNQPKAAEPKETDKNKLPMSKAAAVLAAEDQYTSEYKIKYYVDPITGENKQRKIRPHRVNFKNSKMHGEPVQQDAQADYGMKEGYVAEGGFDNYHEIAKELVKRHGKNVDSGHINDIAGERDTHRGLDHSEVMHHVNKILNKEVKEGDEYDEVWKEYKGKTFKKESRMINFKDYLKEALSAKQKKIAAIAGDKDKIDADDLAALRAGKKPVEEAKKCMDEDDMDESGLRMAAHAAHKAGKKEFEFQGKTYPVKVQKEGVLKPELEKGFPARGVKTGASAPKGTTYMPKKNVKEEVEQIDELSKKTLGSYAHKAVDDTQDKVHDAYDSGTPTRHELEVQGGKNNDGKYGYKPLQNRLTGVARAAKRLGDKEISKRTEKSVAHHLKQRYHYDNMDDRKAANSDNAARHQYYRAKDHIEKASGVKEEVELDEGRMKELAMDLKDMSHDEFHKHYGKPKSYYDPLNFKKPVQKGHEMDRAKALAQRGIQSLSKEEVEQEMSPYLKATLAVMDESKYDDYKDALRSKKATQSAYDKDFKPDTTHPHIQVVKGTQYGGENQKDDDYDEKPDEPKEKRGRGRPAGSKSGARV